MLGDRHGARHRRPSLGPWIGKATNGFDKTYVNRGSGQTASDIIFNDYTQGKGTATEARVRPGRKDYNTDNLYPRYYLFEGGPGETGWSGGVGLSTTHAKTGYGSFKLSNVSTQAHRFFPALLDPLQGGVASASDLTLVFWMRATDPTKLFSAGCYVRVTSDTSGAPATWTNYRQTAFSAGSIAANTWTKVSIPITNMAATGSPDLSALAGIYFELSTTGAVEVYLGEAYIESAKNSHTTAMREFTHAITSTKHLLVKNGDTWYHDPSKSLTFTKIKSGLQRNRTAHFATTFNQAFLADGEQIVTFDGSLNTLGALNVRAAGFPAPSAAGVSVAATSTGTAATPGQHHVFLSYKYGWGSSVFGQSSVTYVGSVTLVAGQRINVTGLPVPAEVEGVLEKRLYVTLSGDPQDAPCYFAATVANATTSALLDLSDITLSAATNPVGPRDNGLPPAAQYMVPYDGSMIYLNLQENPAMLAWARRGTDINSGPEIVPGANRALAQRGEPWTGGIVRGQSFYAFTKHGVFEGRMDQFGIFNISELDQSLSGNSIAVGALSQNAIWADATANIWFLSEQGMCVLEPSNRIRLVTKERLYDEWAAPNYNDPKASTRFRSIDTAADWATGALDANTNLLLSSGRLTYNYPGTLPLDLSPAARASTPFRASADVNQPGRIAQASTAQNVTGLQLNKLEQGGTVYFLHRAHRDIVLSSARMYGVHAYTHTLAYGIHKYKYELGRRTAFSQLDTSCVGTQVMGASDTQTAVDLGYWSTPGQGASIWTFTHANVYIPAGELFWVSLTNASAGAVFPTPTDLWLPGPFDANYRMGHSSSAPVVHNGNFRWDLGSLGWSPMLEISGAEYVQQSNSTVEIDTEVDLSGPIVQRFGTIDVAGALLPSLKAWANREIWIETSVDGITWDAPQLMYNDRYTTFDGSDGKENLATEPFFKLPDYRPAGGAAYPHTIQRLHVRATLNMWGDSPRGNDVPTEADSLVQGGGSSNGIWPITTYAPTLLYSSEADFATLPYARDIWTSAVYDLGATPVEWGRFQIISASSQQKIRVYARTDASNTPTSAWAEINDATPPSLTALPANGRYMQVRVVFEDDPTVANGLMSSVDAIYWSYRISETEIVPLVPPCGVYFDRYHLVAYAPKNGRINTQGWCLSPGEKHSDWSRQTVNCWCVFDGMLLAGRASNPKISRYWDNDVFDDATLPIRGSWTTMPTNIDTPGIKSLMGLYAFTGTRDFNPAIDTVTGAALAANVLPAQTPPVTSFLLSVQHASTDNLAQGAFNPPLTTYQGYYKAETHSTTGRGAVLAGDSYFFDAAAQDAVMSFGWSAWAHKVKNLRVPGTPYVNRFPYLTDIQPEFFEENYYGV